MIFILFNTSWNGSKLEGCATFADDDPGAELEVAEAVFVAEPAGAFLKLGSLGFGLVVKNDVSDLAPLMDVTRPFASFFTVVVVVVVDVDDLVAKPALPTSMSKDASECQREAEELS